jgi:multiple sugar transport system substrate-binding protein
MRFRRPLAALAVTCALTAVAACGGGNSNDNSSGKSGKTGGTITYWASNQGPSLTADKKILTPQLAKFTKQTGIKVKLEVVPWSDLLNRILAATSSGKGPDVLNIGNTWSASLQATGALLPWNSANYAKIGGKDRFVDSAVGSTGAAGQDPAAVPLYSMAYALYYNKALFKQAGIANPPTTWSELVADGKKLNKGNVTGLGIEGSDLSTNIHQAFVLAKQHGADWFDSSGKPTFTGAGNVAAVKQWVDFMATDHIVAKGDAEYSQNQSLENFAKGKIGMLLWQTAASTFKSYGMKESQFGVAQVPVQSGTPGTGAQTNSMVAGINIAVFKNSHNLTGAEKFVKFMTSDPEQIYLNKTYGSIPPVKSAQGDAAFSSPTLTAIKQALSTSAAPLPQVPAESQFETAVGTAIKNLFADAAAGKAITNATVKAELAKAQQQMSS